MIFDYVIFHGIPVKCLGGVGLGDIGAKLKQILGECDIMFAKCQVMTREN